MSGKWRVSLGLMISAGLLISFPVRFNFIVGQPNPLLMWLVAVLLTNKSGKVKGIAAGLLIVIKTNYVLVLASLLKANRRALAIAIGVIAIGLSLSLLLLSPKVYGEYLEQRAQGYIFATPVTTNVDYYNQSLKATMARLHLNDRYVAIFGLATLIGALYLIKVGDVISGVLVSLLLSPIVWQHYVIVVYPILFLVGMTVWRQKRYRVWWLVSFGLLLIHFPRLHGLPASLPYSFIASHYFIGLVTLLITQLGIYQAKNGTIKTLKNGRGRIVA